MKKEKEKDEQKEYFDRRVKAQKEHRKMEHPTPKLATPTIRMFSQDAI
jgi:hypothetical protein